MNQEVEEAGSQLRYVGEEGRRTLSERGLWSVSISSKRLGRIRQPRHYMVIVP